MPASPPPAASAPPPPEPCAPKHSGSRVLPLLVGCALFMQMLDSTVVTTAMPAMATSLGTDPVSMNITITAYLLAAAVFVPISGWAADRFGARRMFMTSVILFTLSSLTCALSSSLGELVAWRVVQGMGGAMMVPVGRILLVRGIPKHELLKAMAFLSIPGLIGPIIGPPLGGFMVTYATWHWIFLINLPIGLLGLWMVVRHVHELPPPTVKPKLDAIGFLLTAVCMATLVGAFELLGHTGLSSPGLVLLMIVVGLLCGWLYVLHARRHADPIIDLTLMRIPTFRATVLAGNLCRFTVGATPFLLALLMQVGFGMSPLASGMITFASAAGALMMKFVVTPILRHWGYRRVLAVNAVLTGVSLALCASFSATTATLVMIGMILMAGCFRSLQFTAINSIGYADITEQKTSRASSFIAMAQQLGLSLGVGVAAGTLNLSMLARGADSLNDVDVRVGLIVVGMVCASASVFFLRLAANAGESLQHPK